MNTYLAAFSIAIIVSLILTRSVRELANRRGWVDWPDPSRKLHKTPIPRVGGIAIYLSLLVSLGIVCLLPSSVATQARENAFDAAILLGLAGLMLSVGLWDDLKTLSPWVKFSAQVLVALASWSLGYRILGVWAGSGTVYYMGMLSLPITVIWIVGVTNAFNLIDGIDGLSSGAALLAVLFLIVVSIHHNQLFTPVILAALAGATLGFLKYNFSPASIFLGDSGSLLLGFVLALVSVRHSEKSTTAIAIAVPIVAFGLPILDTVMAIIRRFLSGKPIFLGDQRHIHHALLDLGLKPRQVVMLLYGVCGLFGLFSLLFLNPSGKTVGFALVVLGACLCFGIQRLLYPELRELNGYFARGVLHRRELITGNMNAGKMVDGFRSAQNLSDLLESISLQLEEMDFTRAEVRLPTFNENRLVLRVRNWMTIVEGRTHCLYRWSGWPSNIPTRTAKGVPSLELAGNVPGNSFRIEFVFEVPPPLGRREEATTIARESKRGENLGRLTFYHPTANEFPVSATCLLCRNIWNEFGNAVSRVLAEPVPAKKSIPAEFNSSKLGWEDSRDSKRDEILTERIEQRLSYSARRDNAAYPLQRGTG